MLGTLAAAILVVTPCGTATAQSSIGVGVLAGVAYSNFTGDQSSGSTTRIGFMGGLTGAFPLGALTALELDVLYSMKGTKWRDVQAEGEYALNYIELPLVLRYSPEVAPGFYGFGGPAVNFIASCQSTDRNGTTISCGSDGLQPQTTVSGVLGVGFKRSLVGAEIRFDFDLSDPLKNDNGVSLNVRNRVVALLIRVGKKPDRAD